jgi:class 3 adenylate cyclase/tetratricopeptide (TPR) repeat protein
MIACPGCGFEAADDAAFCSKCGTKLASSTAACEERKTVTTLFCDLVAFTAMSEAADPEDVDALLGEYFARATKVIESHGGTVEKFIGDAVVGVFGVPAVHEDDPERAVRASLRILEALEGMMRPDGSPLQARCGVNTGEALVRLDVEPSSGRGFLTGDAVNVAARLQAAAPPMGVVIGALAHKLTQRVIAYKPLEPVTAKGKRKPLEAWLALGPVARTGTQRVDHATPFVGRSGELSYLSTLLDKARDSSSPQVALIIGDAGIGKSRLVSELFKTVDAGSQLVVWRQGRCLPYGEGITFWALAEIVKAHAGVLDSDDRETMENKLEQVLPEGEDRPWFRQRLRALLGLEAAEAERQENFTAWLRFLEEVASRDTTVLVLEDLQWADDPLLDFLEFFALHVTHVPLMVVATARPELFQRHPSFAAAVRINRIALEPLSDDQTEKIVGSILDELSTDLCDSITHQAQGNPFFAEESARLAKERAEDHRGSYLAGSVQAVIAARLDALAPDLKSILFDAAVAGDVFWDGLLAETTGRTSQDVSAALDDLVARQLIYRVRTSSMTGQRQYGFSHALAREVAYAQLPRLSRAQKHAAVAAWIEQMVVGRHGELAEVLAYHYVTGLDLARAAEDGDLSESLFEPAMTYLTLAGNRAYLVDVIAAGRHYERGLEISGADPRQHPDLLCGWAKVLALTNRPRESVAVWHEAIDCFLARGDKRKAAGAMAELGSVFETLGEPVHPTIKAALELLADDGPSAELVLLRSADIGVSYVSAARSPKETVTAADQLLAMCRELDLPQGATALHFRGGARMELGDPGGIADVEAAIAAAKEQGLADRLMMMQYNYANWLLAYGGSKSSIQACRDGLEIASRRCNETYCLAFRAALVNLQYYSGAWDEALDEGMQLDAALEAAENNFDRFMTQGTRASILAARGEVAEARASLRWLVTFGRKSEMPWVSAYAVTKAAIVEGAFGEADMIREWLDEALDYGVDKCPELLTAACRTALAIGAADFVCRALEGTAASALPMPNSTNATCRGLLAEAHGEFDAALSGFVQATAGWRDLAIPYEEAQALLGQGRCLLELGKGPKAAQPLQQAREIFERLGARPALEETEGWLTRTVPT